MDINDKRATMRKSGAWAGPTWFCKCRGIAHQESKGECLACWMRRPAHREWFRHSALYSELLAEEIRMVPVAYLSRALSGISAREGLEAMNAAFPHLFAQVAHDHRIGQDTLAIAWGVKAEDMAGWLERNAAKVAPVQTRRQFSFSDSRRP